MKITKDTKIGDLIDDRYELDFQGNRGISVDTKILSIPIKVKVNKDFEWYESHYFNQAISLNIATEKSGYVRDLILRKEYDKIPFEIKIGLLKFICDSIGVVWSDILFDKMNYANFTSKTDYSGVLGICPKEFIQSIVKIKL